MWRRPNFQNLPPRDQLQLRNRMQQPLLLSRLREAPAEKVVQVLCEVDGGLGRYEVDLFRIDGEKGIVQPFQDPREQALPGSVRDPKGCGLLLFQDEGLSV